MKYHDEQGAVADLALHLELPPVAHGREGNSSIRHASVTETGAPLGEPAFLRAADDRGVVVATAACTQGVAEGHLPSGGVVGPRAWVARPSWPIRPSISRPPSTPCPGSGRDRATRPARLVRVEDLLRHLPLRYEHEHAETTIEDVEASMPGEDDAGTCRSGTCR